MAQQHDLEMYQGDSFTLVFRLRDKTTGDPADLTGCTPKSDIKGNVADTAPLLSFTADLLDATDGTVILSLAPDQTATLVPGTTLVWDVQLKWPDNSIKTYLFGSISVDPEVTRGS